MDNPKAFKHQISPQVVDTIAARLAVALPAFDNEAFLGHTRPGFEALELKARLRRISAAARAAWPGPIATLIGALPGLCLAHGGGSDPGEELTGWPVWALLQIIEDHGLEARDESLSAMRALTPRWSAEFAIRPFLRSDPKATLAVLHGWARDSDEHVRRLASEGSRPRLPWGGRLRAFDDDPHHTLPLLRLLRADPSLYVRRSVANHLNDLSKRHGDAVVAELGRWLDEVPSAETTWIARHATRTLIKQGHAGALALRGFGPPALTVESFEVSPPVLDFGGALHLDAQLRAEGEAAQRWAVDFVVHHVKADGSLSPKVFKWREVRATPGASVSLQKSHPIRPISTRRYYPGVHRVTLQINGVVVAETRFTLRMDEPG